MEGHGQYEKLRGLARQLVGDAHLAEDVVQDAWSLYLRQERGSIDKPEAWLRRTIGKLAHTYRRSRARRRAREEKAARPQGVASGQEAVDRASTFDLLQREIAALPDPYGEVLRLHYVDQLSWQEVATRLKRPSNTIRTQHRRGLELMRERLDRRCDGDRSAWSTALVLALVGAGDGVAPAAESAATEAVLSSTVGALRRSMAVLVVILGVATVGWFLFSDTRPLEAKDGAALAAGRDEGELSAPAHQGAERTPVAPAPVEEAQRDIPETETSEDPGRIDLVVSDVEGRPLQGAAVRVMRDGQATEVGTTDAAGRLAVELEEADRGGSGRTGFAQRASLTVALDGYVQSSTYHVPYGQVSELPVTLFAPAGSAAGRVVDEDGNPLENALVQFAWRRSQETPPSSGLIVTPDFASARTDADGNVAIGSLPPGRILVHVSCPGWADSVTFASVTADEEVARFGMQLRKGLTLHGRATDEDGAPLVGARVWYAMVTRGYEYVTETDADGRFALPNMSIGAAFFGVRGEREDQVRIDYVDLAKDGSTEWYPEVGTATGVRFRLVDTEGETQEGWVVRLTARQGVAMWGKDIETGPDLNAVYDVPDVPIMLSVHGPTPGVLPLASFPVHAREEPWVLELPAHAGDVGSLTACAERLPETPLWDGQLTVRGAVGELRQAANPATGCFLVEGLTPGRYEIGWATQDGARFHFGTWELSPSASLDLGLLREPQRGVLRIEGSVPGANYYDLVLDKEFGNDMVADRIHNGPVPPSELRVYPGTYTLTQYDKMAPLGSRRLRIESNEVTHLDLSPDGPRHRLVRFVASSARSESLQWSVFRAEEPDGEPSLGPGSVSGEDGVYEVHLALPPGAYLVHGQTDDGLVAEAVLDLTRALDEPILEVELRR